jgi:hypothetical protein
LQHREVEPFIRCCIDQFWPLLSHL